MKLLRAYNVQVSRHAVARLLNVERVAFAPRVSMLGEGVPHLEQDKISRDQQFTRQLEQLASTTNVHRSATRAVPVLQLRELHACTPAQRPEPSDLRVR